ncbi:hypothetical protein AB7813_08255 [Tardiphaga sp. 20_F10_N6_6]|uniref:hypothetical protein n=1 Tax=Tardiphaga sp. 20_F10_N6_6 TaxID=3240788 RepID=UPI003F8948A2
MKRALHWLGVVASAAPLAAYIWFWHAAIAHRDTWEAHRHCVVAERKQQWPRLERRVCDGGVEFWR